MKNDEPLKQNAASSKHTPLVEGEALSAVSPRGYCAEPPLKMSQSAPLKTFITITIDRI